MFNAMDTFGLYELRGSLQEARSSAKGDNMTAFAERKVKALNE
jgi:hypothetical protein